MRPSLRDTDFDENASLGIDSELESK